jgi:anti-sigma B factor antagonist
MHSATLHPLDALFGIDVSVEADCWVVAVHGELDCRTSGQLRACLTALRESDANTVVDLEHVRFIDSAGIGVLVDAHRTAQRHRRQFSLRAPSRVTQSVLDMTGVTKLVSTEF